MRTWRLALALVVAAPWAAEAAPLCAPGTLASYISLGAAGCTTGAATFFDFSASTPGLETPIPAAAVLVTPRLTGVGLDFGVGVDAGPGDAFSVLIGYSLSGVPFSSNTLSMTGSLVGPDGVVVAIEEKCLGGTFAGSDPSSSCSGTTMDPPLIVFDIGEESDSSEQASFAATSFFDVFTEITIDGGLQGSASLDGTVSNVFGTATAVPEPATLLLLGAGMVATAARRRRTRI